MKYVFFLIPYNIYLLGIHVYTYADAQVILMLASLYAEKWWCSDFAFQ